MRDRIHGGYVIAAGSSVALLLGAVMMLLACATALVFTVVEKQPPQWLAQATFLPGIVWLMGLFTVAGTAGAMVALAVYGFRARWFWRCLVATSVIWLLAVPLGTLIGIFGLALLLRYRRSFPHGAAPNTPAP